MNNQRLGHNLIESLLSLLSILEENGMDMYRLMESKEPLPPLLDSQNIQTVYEVIRFMDEMPGGFLIYQADRDERILYANMALVRMLCCDNREEFRELTGNSFRGIVHPEDLESVEKSIWEQIAASQYDLDYVEYRAVQRGGGICWIEDYGHFVHTDSVGDIFYVFLGDATEKKNRRMAERAALLNEKDRKIRTLMEEYDKEKRLITQEHLRRLEVIEGLSVNYESILYINLDADSILPYRLSGRIEQRFDDSIQAFGFRSYMSEYTNTWVLPEYQELVRKTTSPEYIRQKLSKSKTYYINYQISCEGERQYLQLRIVNVGNKEETSQIVLGCRRIDDEIQKEMEQNQLLEDALGHANLAITAKNAFLSNMSHDMRTPLNAIFGYANLAKQNLEDQSAVLGYLGRIETASRQLLDLIEKVLEISWSEANDSPINESECVLSELMQEIYHTVSASAADKGIDFSIDVSGLMHSDVYCDQEKLRQILLYLLNNAITYTPGDGRVALSVMELESLPNDYAVYQFAVEDTGIGIGQDFLGHIFEPFEREKNTTFSGVHGSGLGLTIARNLTGRLGGSIEVQSTLHRGSIFTATFRFRIQKHPFPLSSGPEITLEKLVGRRILLVEDNELNMEIETDLLTELGFLIEPALNGKIAVEKVKSSQPGDYLLVLMDIQMPVMDGREAAMAIRKLENPYLSQIPIIALSANAFESDRRKSIESGMDAHLTKPLDIPLLLETIMGTIQNHMSLQKHK
ncbi:MAG: response regulator [Lachnospiraceae bacterium]|nr:response regulator [Lachnospiraceae bacterium]